MITYLTWWYADALTFLFSVINIITAKIFHSFSVSLLLKTLFDPWKRDIKSAENVSLDVQFKLMMDNLVSRFVGFVVRLFTIIAGLAVTIGFYLIMLIGLILWLLMPLIILALLAHGILTVMNGNVGNI